MVASSTSWDGDWREMGIGLLPVGETRGTRSRRTPVRAWRSVVIFVSVAAVVAFVLPQILVEHPAQAAAGVTEWSIQPTPPVGLNSAETLGAASCASKTFCEAVGQYRDASNETNFAADQWNGTEWVSQALPKVGTEGSLLLDVSCVSPTFCAAVGNAVSSGVEGFFAGIWDG